MHRFSLNAIKLVKCFSKFQSYLFFPFSRTLTKRDINKRKVCLLSSFWNLFLCGIIYVVTLLFLVSFLISSLRLSSRSHSLLRFDIVCSSLTKRRDIEDICSCFCAGVDSSFPPATVYREKRKGSHNLSHTFQNSPLKYKLPISFHASTPLEYKDALFKFLPVYKPHWLHYYITLTGSLETCIRSNRNLGEGCARWVCAFMCEHKMCNNFQALFWT